MSVSYGGDKITFDDGTSIASGLSHFRNRIINGAMEIDQRNAGASMVPVDAYTLDRWEVREDTDGAVTMQQISDAPTGFKNSARITITTADSSLTGTQRLFLRQVIEGNNVADLAWGTASAKTITLSFWVKSSVIGTFSGSLGNSGNARNYVFTYTINSANTWEYKTVTIPGDTSGTWLTDTGAGVNVFFTLGSGPDYTTSSPNSWVSGFRILASGSTSLIGTLNATWQVTGVQFEIGSYATTFERRAYGTELQLCQRYCQSYTYTTGTIISVGTTFGSAVGVFVLPFIVPLRNAPSLITIPTLGSGAGQWAVLLKGGGYPSTFGTIAAGTASPYQMRLDFSGMTSMFVDGSQAVTLYASGNPVVTVSAEY